MTSLFKMGQEKNKPVSPSDRSGIIFDFNHISPDLTEETLKGFCKTYHKKWWCYNRAFRRFKRESLSLSPLSAGAIISGATAGGVTLNPIVLGVLTSIGVIAKVIANYKKYDKKIEMSRYAATTYKKVLEELRMYLRGGKELYDHQKFILAMKIIDDTIVDNCPEIEEKFSKKYHRIFSE